MFEQSLVQPGPASKRLWATCVGVAGQVSLVICAVLAPMMFPQVLPRAVFATILVPPGPPPGPPPPRGPEVRHTSGVHTTKPLLPGAIITPTHIPDRVERIIDLPDEPTSFTVVGGVGPGDPNGRRNGVIGGLAAFLATAQPTPAPRAEPRREPPPPEPVPIQRVPGGRVNPGPPIHRVEPVYPALARTAHVFGPVELQGVIGIDGRIRELRVVSGHPLLAKAALDAVSQWIYRPTTLNDKPVEVITTIVVTFRLN